MIVIDVPMPARCMVCPCVGHFRNEQDDIRSVCGAKKARGDRYVIVNAYAPGRPEDCPIRMEVLGRRQSE